VVATANDGSGATGSEQVAITSNSVVRVTGISVSGASSLALGAIEQMGVSVSPSNATNQTVSWSLAPGANGAAAISQSGLLTATALGTVTVVATANDGSGATGSEQVAINPVAYATPTYTLTYTAGANGSITGVSPQTVSQGATGTVVSAVPFTGYQFMAWSDGSTFNPRIDADAQASINVVADFAPIPAPLIVSTSTNSVQTEITQLRAQLVVLLQELLAMLQSQAAH
jgi:hypothetical protein